MSTAESSGVRLDSWVWSVRLFKTRSAAAAACRAGHVRVNGSPAKPAQLLRVDDEVRVRVAGTERIVVVARLLKKRVGAPEAALCLIDKTPPPPPREVLLAVPQRDRGAGRPTKRERRELNRLRGFNED
ncbi:RNA-binding S4 domain-containing protein [Rhodococcus spelaei]|uniref:RNA-binding S4 domain-containing protein n=1 Tax=Rhodococcus spelaei TaxID=2546320 RepID=A0A541B7Q9_9NOCA|nr:RNA-binding S4 domain-containing protein [Rhodococcus spelaei]TQF68356.1 RNA-binding S4 domain-containing protein [Rhodococcus spelaei]